MTHNFLVVGLDDRVFNFKAEESVPTTALKGWLAQELVRTRTAHGTCSKGEAANFHLTLGGAPLKETDLIPCGQEWGTTLIRAHPIIRGGKGGFGALIRAVGSRANRSNNKEACRDLSGRRLRDVNAQKKVSKWIEDEPERKRRRREEKRKRLLQKKVPPKHFFDDQAYMNQLRANEEDMDSALKQGLVASSSKGVKRKQPEASGASGSKKAKLWMGVEGDDDMSSEESEEESESGSRDGDQYEEGGRGLSGSDQGAVLNSAGSSDEAGRSKPSDEEDDEVEDTAMQHAQLPESNGASSTADIPIQPLERGDNPDQNHEASTTIVTAEVEEHTPLPDKEQQTSEGSSGFSGEASNSEATSTLELGDGTDTNTEAKTASEEETQPSSDGPLDLEGYSSAGELESVGAERLKSVLQSLGLKCGGTLQERAQRLFSTKGKSRDELDPSLFAKAGKSRKRKNK